MKFNCPGCGHAINAPEGAEGKQGDCPSCGKTVTIPIVQMHSALHPYSEPFEPTAIPMPPQIQHPIALDLPPEVPVVQPFSLPSGKSWIVIGFIILGIAFIWTAYYFLEFDTTTGPYSERIHNTGLMHERTVGIIIGCAEAIGGLLFILTGYLSHCMTCLKETVRLITQTQK